MSDCPLIFELLNFCHLALSNSLIGHKNNVAKYVWKKLMLINGVKVAEKH